MGPFSFIISLVFLHVSLFLFYFLFFVPLFEVSVISLFYSLFILYCVFIWGFVVSLFCLVLILCVCVCMFWILCVWSSGRRDKSNKGGETQKGKTTWRTTRKQLEKERKRGRAITRSDSLAVKPFQTNNGGRGLMSLPRALCCNKGLLLSLGFFVLSYF